MNLGNSRLPESGCEGRSSTLNPLRSAVSPGRFAPIVDAKGEADLAHGRGDESDPPDRDAPLPIGVYPRPSPATDLPRVA